ncbi:Metallopeptidase family M24 (plasmid) [Pseudovibrio sp. FO-BEG1]|uniref:aminopeptidase P family protein n=1 Tax=Pseudovibrio sp. (strain FO-BEG1) TaxID=911045 RepID=UPI000238D417|nr:aminopeptidase P family protein [Pseudovibrio sp. FO-BEG1]AEV39931.1 Metallopeptidase family M24 [Pseudovibrio sp. FO-BEG1]
MLENQKFETTTDRLNLIRTELKNKGLDGVIIPRFDEHQGEYCAPHDERLAWATGFTGSAGLAIITADQAVMFVDGRYTVQVRNQCSSDLFSYQHIFDEPLENWISANMKAGQQIGVDPMLIPSTWWDRFAGGAEDAGAVLVATTSNIIDAVWSDQPEKPLAPITPYSLENAGKTSLEKRAEIALQLKDAGAKVLVETQPDNIAWLLNVRGDDVEFNPIPHSFLLLKDDGSASWFVDSRKLSNDLSEYELENVETADPSSFISSLEKMTDKGTQVLIDPMFSPVATRLAVQAAGGVPVMKPGAVTLTKAKKNESELKGLRDCHIRDGIAWTEFSAWLKREVPQRAEAGDPVHELEAEERILMERQRQKDFVYPSFRSISAAAGNAAMCHYAATEASNTAILPENTYLLDSGGQYQDGTTDATRTFAFTETSEEFKRAYTAVFKGFVALASLRFPKGTQGHHIDGFARRPLWELGLDYDHGTGHGIGHFLSVHEQPQRIGKPYNPVDLVAGMVMSIEPGYYVADQYGIRIENLFEIVEEDDGFLAFRNLSYIPIEPQMLNMVDLTRAEIKWLGDYNADLKRVLGPELSPDAYDYLMRCTELPE